MNHNQILSNEKLNKIILLLNKDGECKNFHVTWGPDAHILSPNERADALIQCLEQCPNAQEIAVFKRK